MEFRVADQFKLKQKIGGGSFGEIYSGINVSNDTSCAVKLEKTDLKVRHLLYEYRVYSLLFDEFGFPKILHYGTEGDYNCLVMQLLGPSLEDYLKRIKNFQYFPLVFASINAHKGIELSRRDDLESLGYLFIYLLKGELPWQDLQPTLDGRYSNIGEMKVKLPLSDLCGELPTEFSSYILYCRELQFNQKPDYLGLRLMFKRLLQRLSSNPNDWVIESIQ
ncbi:non-specific serine/threonine protein kinase [Entamoeba marina]